MTCQPVASQTITAEDGITVESLTDSGTDTNTFAVKSSTPNALNIKNGPATQSTTVDVDYKDTATKTFSVTFTNTQSASSLPTIKAKPTTGDTATVGTCKVDSTDNKKVTCDIKSTELKVGSTATTALVYDIIVADPCDNAKTVSTGVKVSVKNSSGSTGNSSYLTLSSVLLVFLFLF